MKLLQKRFNMMKCRGSSNYTSSWVLHQLKFVDSVQKKTKQKRITLDNVTGNQAVEHDGSKMGREKQGKDDFYDAGENNQI